MHLKLFKTQHLQNFTTSREASMGKSKIDREFIDLKCFKSRKETKISCLNGPTEDFTKMS